jgi:peptide chain release factor 2
MQKLSRLRLQLEPWERLYKQGEELNEWLGLLSLEPDETMLKDVMRQVESLSKSVSELDLLTLLGGGHDRSNALLEINSGAGGTEACDWAQMLLRIYLRWAQRRGFHAEIVDETPGTITGYSSVGVLIEGEFAYGFLKSETGVHRLVRISPFDANKRRHTSFVAVEVMPEMEETEFQLNMEEVKIETYRAGGHGGQHVNKTESAIRVTHLPTGLVATCQSERSQHQNKALALKVLASRVADYERKQNQQKMKQLRGDVSPAEWGHQIRSYVLQPYTLIKDHRTDYETGNVQAVLDGEIDDFLEAYLRWNVKKPVGV